MVIPLKFWRGSKNARLPPMWPGFNSGPVHMWVEFVVGSRLAPRVFLYDLRFPSSTKTNISKFHLDQDRGPT